jgi:hypothetical protein
MAYERKIRDRAAAVRDESVNGGGGPVNGELYRF